MKKLFLAILILSCNNGLHASDYLKPYGDQPWQTRGLWHFNELMTPDDDGILDKRTPDDDSNNIIRNRNVTFYQGTSIVTYGVSGGPQLLDPGTISGVGYPHNDLNFGQCLYFDGLNTTARASNLLVDPCNFRVEAWVRLDDSVEEYGILLQYWILAWNGQLRLYIGENTTNTMSVYATVWDSAATASSISKTYASMGVDYHQWHHIAVEVNDFDVTLYVNGINVGSKVMAHIGTRPNMRAFTYIGSNESLQNKFWGYIDEMRISDLRTPMPCGAWGYLPGDISKDCKVDFGDVKDFAQNWLANTDPCRPNAVITNNYPEYETFNIPRAKFTPVINGTLGTGEWDDAKRTDMIYPDLITPPQIGSVKYTGPASPSDLSAYYYYKWDPTYLYVAIHVVDSVKLSGQYPLDNASLLINLLNNPAAALSDVANYNMYRNDSNNTTYIVNGSSNNPAFNPVNAITASTLVSDGYVIEAALKWSDFAGYTPNVGDIHGLATTICDNDTGGTLDTLLFDFGSGNTNAANNPLLYRKAKLTNGLVCGDKGYMRSDINSDCISNFKDFARLATKWLVCTNPSNADCVIAGKSEIPLYTY